MSVPTSTQRFFGGLLMGMGGLMMGLCGACSALALIAVVPSVISLISGMISGRSNGDDYALVFVQSFVLFGVIPILFGWGLFVWGRRIRGETKAPAPSASASGDDAP